MDPLALPLEYNQTTVTLAQPEWLQLLAAITCSELRKSLESVVTKVEPNKELVDWLPGSILARVRNAAQFVGILAFDKWTSKADGPADPIPQTSAPA